MYILIFLLNLLIFWLFVMISPVRKKIVKLLKNENIHNQMELLYGQVEREYQERAYIENKIKKLLLILLVGSAIAVISNFVSDLNPLIDEENNIIRDVYDGEDKKVSLHIQSEELIEDKSINITVSKRRYSDVELEEKSEEVIKKLDVIMLGENESVDCINKNLNLVNKVENYPFVIDWKVENPLLISKKGEIDFKRLSLKLNETGEESLIVKLIAVLNYDDYSKENIYFINLHEKNKSQDEKFIEELQSLIDKENFDSRENESLHLPEYINGKFINYSSDKNTTSLLILLLSVVAAVLIFYSSDSDLEKRLQERNEQMELDYPRIVNRYALFYSAGMHPKAIWKEICGDYRKNVARTGERRYAFEQMLKTEAAMADGVGEISALNEFAVNCRLRKYRRFVSLIEQSLQKGKNQMGEDLRKEAEDAINERLSLAKIKGEEAGTKMLLPMFLMLMVVLIIVIVPAFVNFKV